MKERARERERATMRKGAGGGEKREAHDKGGKGFRFRGG